jgi:hypothetical protein
MQQQGRVWYLGPGVMMKKRLSPQATKIRLRFVTAAAKVTSWTTTISPGTWKRPSLSFEMAVLVGAAETGIVQTIDHNRSIFRERVAQFNHLREDGRYSISREDPAGRGDCLGDDTQCWGGVCEAVGVAAADEERRHVLLNRQVAGGEYDSIPWKVGEGIKIHFKQCIEPLKEGGNERFLILRGKGGDRTRKPLPTLSLKELVLKPVKGSVQIEPAGDMTDWFSFGID